MPENSKRELCEHINRVSLHSSIRIGGASTGRCSNEVLPGMTVCIDHAYKESLAYYIKSLYKEVETLKAENESLKKKDRGNV